MKSLKPFVLGIAIAAGVLLPVPALAQQSNGSVGIEGRISSAPPSVGATISVPRDGQVFTELPITVSGICPGDVLVKVFKNNVFGGAAQCTNGSFSLQIDLFSGRNELIARVYDALDQAGPDSNTVGVTYNDSRGFSASRPTLTSNFAKRGANPGETLIWPITLSGGSGPYAINIDWGDGKPSDLFTRDFAGNFDITHVYDRAGSYNIVIRASDNNGGVAFLQLVGVANGPLSQDEAEDSATSVVITKVLWWPLLGFMPVLFLAFWLGRRHAVQELRERLEKEHSF